MKRYPTCNLKNRGRFCTSYGKIIMFTFSFARWGGKGSVDKWGLRVRKIKKKRRNDRRETFCPLVENFNFKNYDMIFFFFSLNLLHWIRLTFTTNFISLKYNKKALVIRKLNFYFQQKSILLQITCFADLDRGFQDLIL